MNDLPESCPVREKKTHEACDRPPSWSGKLNACACFCLHPFDSLDRRRWFAHAGGLLASFILLSLVSFALLALGDQLNASGMVVTRFMARIQAPLSAHFYPPEAQRRISVLMYDPAYLKASGSAWPISYGDHAEWLMRIAGNEAARPRAIMLDVTFGQERDDPTLPQLQSALCTIRQEYQVPVFLAALPSPQDGLLRVRQGLAPIDPESGRPCFTLVDVGYEPDPLDGHIWNYPLSRHLGPDGWADGPPREVDAAALQSAAMVLAQEAGGIDLGKESSPMALVWGLHTPDLRERPELFAYCRPGVTEWSRLLPGVVRDLVFDVPRQPVCPYHSTLSMAQVWAMDEAALAPYVADRFVMIGAFVPGFNDLVRSPIHGLIPGIYMHAMALDNLLTYRADYKTATDWSAMWESRELWKAGLAAIAAIFAVHLLWSLARAWIAKPRWFIRRCRKKPFYAWYRKNRSLPRRSLGLIVDALIWLLKRLAQAAAALLLVAVLQTGFRIGMLPVVELVTMALVAEGLDVMKRIRLFLSGEVECPARK